MTGTSLRVLLLVDASRPTPARELVTRVGESTPLVELHAVSSLADAVTQLDDERFDAALLDLSVPGGGESGLDTLARLHDYAPEVPILALITPDDDVLGVRALKAGAQDSLIKGQVDEALLSRAIRYAIERNQLQMALRAMSLVDELTGLYNRRGFLTLARQQIKMSDRMGRRVTSIFVDLDGLKAINDSFGHLEGDQALVETAELLRETFRDSDIIARIGGDEFVVLALENNGANAETWTRRLAENLRHANTSPARRFPLSVSMGVAYYDPAFPCALEDLLARADNLMYAEKRRKRATPAVGLLPTNDWTSMAPRAD